MLIRAELETAIVAKSRFWCGGLGAASCPAVVPAAAGEAPELAVPEPRVEDPQPPAASKPATAAANRPQLSALVCPRLSLLVSSSVLRRPQLSVIRA